MKSDRSRATARSFASRGERLGPAIRAIAAILTVSVLAAIALAAAAPGRAGAAEVARAPFRQAASQQCTAADLCVVTLPKVKKNRRFEVRNINCVAGGNQPLAIENSSDVMVVHNKAGLRLIQTLLWSPVADGSRALATNQGAFLPVLAQESISIHVGASQILNMVVTCMVTGDLVELAA